MVGTVEAVPKVVTARGEPINTAVMARVNLTRRQPVAAGGRRVITVGPGEEGVRQQLALSPTYDNVGWLPAN
jgi:hypothetical protein